MGGCALLRMDQTQQAIGKGGMTFQTDSWTSNCIVRVRDCRVQIASKASMRWWLCSMPSIMLVRVDDAGLTKRRKTLEVAASVQLKSAKVASLMR
jgi:hypothetical protein